ncbi:hypothetical protein KGO95_00280 [Patescibacteria group bacterium]|nr:hypothetical protein [Patescibacteria group bacterium]
MNNKWVIGIIGAIVIAGGAFYGGMLYGRSSAAAANSPTGRFGNFTAGARGSRFAGEAAGTPTTLVAGDVIVTGSQSITVQLSNGSTTTPAAATGSKIVFLNSATPIMKTTAGTLQDLGVGTHVVITGTTNTDGSIQAQDVQIRPLSLPGTGQ